MSDAHDRDEMVRIGLAANEWLEAPHDEYHLDGTLVATLWPKGGH